MERDCNLCGMPIGNSGVHQCQQDEMMSDDLFWLKEREDLQVAIRILKEDKHNLTVKLQEAVEIIKEGTMLIEWLGVDAMKLKEKAQVFLAQGEK